MLFVCLGNICRSPMAEGVFRGLLERDGLAHRVEVDSAGMGDWHRGSPPDQRAREAAGRRVAALQGLSRQAAERRLFGFLSLRGFSSDVVWKVVRESLVEKR